MAIQAHSENFGPLNKIYWGTAPPSVAGDGTYQQGDIMYNTAPSASNPPGWMCVTSGTPGTWKAMANLAA